jgi:hypothetical protein
LIPIAVTDVLAILKIFCAVQMYIITGGYMILKSLSVALMTLIMISPLHAEDATPTDAVAADARPEAPVSPIEQRIRAYRESFDRRQENLPANDKVLSKYQQEIQAQMEARQQAYIKQREERRALAAKWREARKKYREAQMETWLKQAEDRQARDISYHEALRSQAEERHNYLVQNHEELLENTLQQQIDFANRQEEMRKQAEERRKQLATFRANMKDMTPEERWAELEKYRTELFGETANPQRVVPPSHMPWQVQPPRPPYAGPPVAE